MVNAIIEVITYSTEITKHPVNLTIFIKNMLSITATSANCFTSHECHYHFHGIKPVPFLSMGLLFFVVGLLMFSAFSQTIKASSAILCNLFNEAKCKIMFAVHYFKASVISLNYDSNHIISQLFPMETFSIKQRTLRDIGLALECVNHKFSRKSSTIHLTLPDPWNIRLFESVT